MALSQMQMKLNPLRKLRCYKLWRVKTKRILLCINQNPQSSTISCVPLSIWTCLKQLPLQAAGYSHESTLDKCFSDTFDLQTVMHFWVLMTKTSFLTGNSGYHSLLICLALMLSAHQCMNRGNCFDLPPN